MKKIYIPVLIVVLLFCSCSMLSEDNEITENAAKEILYIFNNGRIAQKEISSQELNENILTQFYYYNNKENVSNKNYLVSIEECEQYLSEWFDISAIELSQSYYFDSDTGLLDLTGCIDLDGLSTTVTMADYYYEDGCLEIIFNINYLIGDDINITQKHIVFDYNDDLKNYTFKEVGNLI